MRVLGFSKKWPKLEQKEFSTFRYSRIDKDWGIREEVKVVFQPRRKGGGDVLGIAKIINTEVREFDKVYSDMMNDGVPLITEKEAIADGFNGVADMINWLKKTYGRLDFMPRMNKLTLYWIERFNQS